MEGETLAESVAKGPLPVEEALEVSHQIAEGRAAHESGIIHRDLKPANVKITPEGKVEVLDFGLAKALEGEGPFNDASQSPTLTKKMTGAGAILGTAAYMSPWQAKGSSPFAQSRGTDPGCFIPFFPQRVPNLLLPRPLSSLPLPLTPKMVSIPDVQESELLSSKSKRAVAA